MPVITGLVNTHHVIAPDMPGLGASEVRDGLPTGDTVLAWLGELIEQVCSMSSSASGDLAG